LTSSIKRTTTCVASAAVIAAGLLPVTSAAAFAAAPSSVQLARPIPDTFPIDQLSGLTDFTDQRLQLADKVAAAKFGTTSPIDDPVREQQVIDQVTALSQQIGLDPAVGSRFFRAQIEANKVVQRGLFARWTAHPETAPTEKPDLATEVRPALDRLNGQLLDQLLATSRLRGATARCRIQLKLAGVVVVLTTQADALHRSALRIALAPVCEGGTA
jgi:chorismate mutase